MRGRASELPGELDGCIAASMEAAFGRAAEEVFAKVHVGKWRSCTRARLSPGHLGTRPHRVLSSHGRCRGSCCPSSSDLQLFPLSMSADEDRIMLLAAAAGEVLQTEFSKFSPLLLPYVASCRAVAARTLHELYGAKMLPWLIAGGWVGGGCPQ